MREEGDEDEMEKEGDEDEMREEGDEDEMREEGDEDEISSGMNLIEVSFHEHSSHLHPREPLPLPWSA